MSSATRLAIRRASVEEAMHDNAVQAVELFRELATPLAELERLRTEAKRLGFEPQIGVPETLVQDALCGLCTIVAMNRTAVK